MISDNVSNMVEAMQEASSAHFGCFAHSLQLVVKDGLLSQRAITDIPYLLELWPRGTIIFYPKARIKPSK